MKLGRRDFIKGLTAGSGVFLASRALPVAASSEKKKLSPQAIGILYDATLCIGCQACMVACKEANEMPVEHGGSEKLWDNPRDLSARTLNIIKKYSHGSGAVKNRETDGYSFIKRQCMHCVDPACVSACPVSALIKEPETGIVTYRPEACIGCRYCQVACPYNIPKYEWDAAFPRIYKCQLCSHLVSRGGVPACCGFCPTGAALFGPVEDLLSEARRRQAMQPGSFQDYPVSSLASGELQSHRVAAYVPTIYGENELGGSQVLVMAGVPFAKLGLPELPDESYVELADAIQYAIYKGMFYPVLVLGGLIYMIRKGETHPPAPAERNKPVPKEWSNE